MRPRGHLSVNTNELGMTKRQTFAKTDVPMDEFKTRKRDRRKNRANVEKNVENGKPGREPTKRPPIRWFLPVKKGDDSR